MSPSPGSAAAVEALLRDLGPRLRRGPGPDAEAARLSTGIPPLDDLLGGGFPGGRLSELAGPVSCGRTSLALSLLARATGRGEVTAVVDLADALHPASAEAAGVELERVLWVRPQAQREALRCAEHLLSAHGFALVVLDVARGWQHTAPSIWTRLARAAAGTGTALVVLSAERVTSSAAEIALELRLERAHFGGTPPLLEGLDAEVSLVRGGALAPRRIRVRLDPWTG